MKRLVRTAFAKIGKLFERAPEQEAPTRTQRRFEDFERFHKVEVPKRAREIAERIVQGNYDIKEINPLAVRAAVFNIFESEPNGKQLIARLNAELKEHWKKTE